MTQIEAVKAYKVLQGLSESKMPIQTALSIFRLKKSLQPAYEFHAEQERAIIERYKATIDEKGMYHTADPEDMEKMRNDMTELCQMVCEFKADQVEIKADESIRMTPSDIEALEPVVKII